MATLAQAEFWVALLSVGLTGIGAFLVMRTPEVLTEEIAQRVATSIATLDDLDRSTTH